MKTIIKIDPKTVAPGDEAAAFEQVLAQQLPCPKCQRPGLRLLLADLVGLYCGWDDCRHEDLTVKE